MIMFISGKCANLETLNLTMAQGVTAEGLTAILEGCSSLQSLNISWCDLSEAALTALVQLLPAKLQRLNLSGARTLTDDSELTLFRGHGGPHGHTAGLLAPAVAQHIEALYKLSLYIMSLTWYESKWNRYYG